MAADKILTLQIRVRGDIDAKAIFDAMEKVSTPKEATGELAATIWRLAKGDEPFDATAFRSLSHKVEIAPIALYDDILKLAAETPMPRREGYDSTIELGRFGQSVILYLLADWLKRGNKPSITVRSFNPETKEITWDDCWDNRHTTSLQAALDELATENEEDY